MNIEIDERSGFCFGVQNAIDRAEKAADNSNKLYSLGEIVHNKEEVSRLKNMGIEPLSQEAFKNLHNASVLIRAHGVPPEIYKIAGDNNITVIDATCPIVLKLQRKIKEEFTNYPERQIVIFGKEGHPEVKGLVGQTNGNAIVIRTEEDLHKINPDKPVSLYVQTTMDVNEFKAIQDKIYSRLHLHASDSGKALKVHDSICREVSNRDNELKEFCRRFDINIFVSGKNSSNGKMLYNICKKENPNTYFISRPEEIREEWLKNINSAGICGANSTPAWLLHKTKEHLTMMENKAQ